MDIKEEDILGSDINTHWYYISKGRALRSFIKGIQVNEVLDVGAGSGIFSRQLLDAGICESAICIDPAYPTEHTELHNSKQIRFVRSVEQVTQQLVLMMDVLEHVDNDLELLTQYTQALSSGSHVLITVPAFEFLWSGHDVFLEHRRRYTRRSLMHTITKANLQIVRCRYFYGLLFPLIAAKRGFDQIRMKHKKIEAKSDLRNYSAAVNRTLTLIHDIERVTLFPVNIFAGLTVFCLARRL